jgi:hypothetical protein
VVPSRLWRLKLKHSLALLTVLSPYKSGCTELVKGVAWIWNWRLLNLRVMIKCLELVRWHHSDVLYLSVSIHMILIISWWVVLINNSLMLIKQSFLLILVLFLHFIHFIHNLVSSCRLLRSFHSWLSLSRISNRWLTFISMHKLKLFQSFNIVLSDVVLYLDFIFHCVITQYIRYAWISCCLNCRYVWLVRCYLWKFLIFLIHHEFLNRAFPDYLSCISSAWDRDIL